MKPYQHVLVLMAIIILSQVVAGNEIAYIFSTDGEKTVGQGNITEYKGSDIVSFTVAKSNEGIAASYKSKRTVDDIKTEIYRKVNRGNEPVRDEGLSLVGSKSGAQRIDQVCSIYDYMVGNWTYVSDWMGSDEFQYSNYTLKKGIEVGSSGKGDCDDFSILLAALIESIGGTPRVMFSYSPTGGHAYTEVYLGKRTDRDVGRMLRWLRAVYNVDDISGHVDTETGDVWLNMDWWKDSGGANHPGGPLYKADTHIPMYIQVGDEDKTPLTPIQNSLPIASFICTPLQPEVDQIVSFDASQSYDPDGKITNYEWGFGDGDTAKGAMKSSCRHYYQESGKFPVTLAVTDNEGDNSYKTMEIIVNEPLPEAIFTYSPAQPAVGDVVTFNASKSKDKKGQIIEYEWDFGDGYPGKGGTIAHQYLISGTYSAKLAVINDKGAKNSSFVKVEVSPKSESIAEIASPDKPSANPYSSEAAGWYDNGIELDKQGKYDEAIQAYDAAIRLDPQYALAWNGKGIALGKQGKLDEALESLDKALELDPSLAIAWNGKGNCFYGLGKYDEAFKAFDEAIKLDPKLTKAWLNKGNAFGSQGKYDEALEAYDKALETDPRNPDAWNGKGVVLGKQGKLDEALESLDKALELDPSLAIAWNGKGNCLNDLGRYYEALEALNKALELNPSLVAAWYNKGNCFYGLGKYDEAIVAYDNALEIDPRIPDAWNNKGTALGQQGKYYEALEAFNRAIELDPSLVRAWNNKGKTLELLGRTMEAEEVYAKAKELGYTD